MKQKYSPIPSNANNPILTEDNKVKKYDMDGFENDTPLSEISIYTTTKEGTVPLADVLKKIHTEYGNDLGLDAEADPTELKSFIKSVLPEYDESRVYVSDIKKLVKWYSVLLKYAPEILALEEKKEEKA